MAETHLVYCTFPDAEQAEAVAEQLVTSRLTACVQVSPPLLSIYRWEGKLCKSPEVQVTLKTTDAALSELCARLLELHPYDCPEILTVAVDGGNPDYLRWVQEAVESG